MKEIKLNVTLQYNPETDTIDSYKVTLDGVANKTTTTKKVGTTKKSGLEGLVVVREEGKLVLSEQLLAELGAVHEDRINIVYEKIGVGDDKKTFPVIGKSESFGGKEAGNKLTKTNTVQYRGKANETLAAFGTTFGVELYKEGIYKLIGDVQADMDVPVKKAVQEVVMSIETTTDTNYEIEDLTDTDIFKL